MIFRAKWKSQKIEIKDITVGFITVNVCVLGIAHVSVQIILSVSVEMIETCCPVPDHSRVYTSLADMICSCFYRGPILRTLRDSVVGVIGVAVLRKQSRSPPHCYPLQSRYAHQHSGGGG